MTARKRPAPGVMVAFRCPPRLLARLMKWARPRRFDRTSSIVILLERGLPR